MENKLNIQVSIQNKNTVKLFVLDKPNKSGIALKFDVPVSLSVFIDHIDAAVTALNKWQEEKEGVSHELKN